MTGPGAAAAEGELTPARRAFVETWGEMGSRWGISRTMAQIHALLMTQESPLSTDEIMELLQISRGNANMNLRELVAWSLVRKVVRLGERKDFYEAEKDIWKIFCNIVRERKRREITPLLEAFKELRGKAADSAEPPAFQEQLAELERFVRQAHQAMDKLSRLDNAHFIPFLLRTLDRKED
ncbi:MAG: transcriptional regulator [Puniceicoccaceae bacterium]|nr:MAG: transcriptional regulator [Puniceicoccaceae bacterium]